MAPPHLRPLDAAEEADRLSQPFRMIDHLLGALLDDALRVGLLRKRERELAASCKVDQVVLPRHMCVASGPSGSFCLTPAGAGSMLHGVCDAVSASALAQLCARDARVWLGCKARSLISRVDGSCSTLPACDPSTPCRGLLHRRYGNARLWRAGRRRA